MLNSNTLDTFIVSQRRDLHLLRIFLASYQAYFRSKGEVHLLISGQDKGQIASLCLPRNVNIHFKEDSCRHTKDDFRNQMFYKLICDQYAKSDYIWMVDSDYVITKSLHKTDFFCGDRPNWYYRKWSKDPAEQMWRHSTECFLNDKTLFQFMEEPQYIFRRDILRELRRTYDIEKVLTQNSPPSEFMIYGHFAFHKYRDQYAWCSLDVDGAKPLGFKINQRPPTYSVLAEAVKLETFPGYKYFVFWSRWEHAERKMLEFLAASQRAQPWIVKKRLGKSPKKRAISVARIQYWRDILTGFYADGWMFQKVEWNITTLYPNAIYLVLDVISERITTAIIINGKCKKIHLDRGINRLKIPLRWIFMNKVQFVFAKKNVTVENTGRNLYARIIDVHT